MCPGAGSENLAAEAILIKCVRRIPRGGETMPCLGEMGEEGQQQGWPSVISSVLCRGNHGASPARVAMRTDQMEGAGGTLNLPSLPPPRRTLACALARTRQKEVPGSPVVAEGKWPGVGVA